MDTPKTKATKASTKSANDRPKAPSRFVSMPGEIEVIKRPGELSNRLERSSPAQEAKQMARRAEIEARMEAKAKAHGWVDISEAVYQDAEGGPRWMSETDIMEALIEEVDAEREAAAKAKK